MKCEKGVILETDWLVCCQNALPHCMLWFTSIQRLQHSYFWHKVHGIMVKMKHELLLNHAIYCNKCTLLKLPIHWQTEWNTLTNPQPYLHFGEYYSLYSWLVGNHLFMKEKLSWNDWNVSFRENKKCGRSERESAGFAEKHWQNRC